MTERLQPTLNAVRAFEATARLGSLKAAATELGVTSSAVSHHVRLLEGEIGKRLFIRHNNAIELTPDGQRLFEQIRPALRTIARATEGIRSDATTVSMNVTTWFALHWLIPRLRDFHSRHPRVAIDMTVVQRPVVLDDSVELIVSYTRHQPPRPGAVELLNDFAQPMVAPGTWRDKKGKELDLREIPLIGSTMDDADWRIWAEASGFDFRQLRMAYRFDTDVAVVNACRAGLGVALVPTETGLRDVERGALVPFGEFQARSYGIYWLVTAPKLRRPARLFVDWLLKVAPKVDPRPSP